MNFEEKLAKIRSPKLQSQQSTQIVLSAVEDTLRDQKTKITPAGYFAALLALLGQSVSKTDVNIDLATSVVYLLDIVTPYTPQPLLRSKFSQILSNLAPALTFPEANASLLRPSIGCLKSLLVAQDSAAWNLGQAQIGPRRGLAGLLVLAVDHRPKVRKSALDAIAHVLKNPPCSVAVDHPAADMCAENALKKLADLSQKYTGGKKERNYEFSENDPGLIHVLQLVKTVATVSAGWPVKKFEFLCEVLLNISKSSNHFLTMAVFNLFEIIFQGMASAEFPSKLPRLLEVISEIRPCQNDSQSLPSWIAVISKGYEVSAKMQPEETFHKLSEVFTFISEFLSSPSGVVRDSACNCLKSLIENCIPNSVLLEPSIYDQKALEKLGKAALQLLSVNYQVARLQIFSIIGLLFEKLRWQAEHILIDIVKITGDLREHHNFVEKREADQVIGRAIYAIGPEAVLKALPLNLLSPKKGHPGRAWILPLLRDNVHNTNLNHFKKIFIPLSEAIFQRVIDHNENEKTMEIKIFETLVQQIWAILPGYCNLPLDLLESFDQGFAELISNLLYSQTDLRSEICKGLMALVDSNKAISHTEGSDDPISQNRVTKDMAQRNLNHLSNFASNMLAVLFNVYSQTMPQYRGYILQCINAYLSIMPVKDVTDTFDRVTNMFGTSLEELSAQAQSDKQAQNQKNKKECIPPTTHTLMDLIVTISPYLPQESFQTLFNLLALIIKRDDDPQLQKKVYKIIPRLSESNDGKKVLVDESYKFQQLLISGSEYACTAAKKNRLATILTIIPSLSNDSLHFIPTILSEIVISCKENNEKARKTAFDLLIVMGEKIASSTNALIENKKIPHMPDDAPSVSASLEEYFTMVSAGLAGSTPHMQSACVIALTRILFHFHERLASETISELIVTMDLYLASNNREIVRSVLGFVKVCVISLPVDLMLPHLSSLVPHLMVWSHEHKGQFKAKIKHIIERMIRRFGFEPLNKFCSIEDRKLISHIRKTNERRKRLKATQSNKDNDTDLDGNHTGSKSKTKEYFESEYDAAIYGSNSSSDKSDTSEDEISRKNYKDTNNTGKTYIVEDDEEPLDLLDQKALANVMTAKPSKQKLQLKSEIKMNIDGKLLFENPNDAMILDGTSEAAPDEGGINAYVKAIMSEHAPKKGRSGKLKFSNKKNSNDGDDMDLDQDDINIVRNKYKTASNLSKVNKTNGKSISSRTEKGEQKRHRNITGGRVTKPSKNRRSLR